MASRRNVHFDPGLHLSGHFLKKQSLEACYLLFVMELKTRRVHFAGCTTNPHEAWMKQMARELTNHEDGFLKGKQYLIMDRDTKFCE
jgi:hypothetical protein